MSDKLKLKNRLYPLTAALLITILIGAGAIRRVDRWVQDWLFQRRGVTSSDIILIGIDEYALRELGPYNSWDRNVMASALEALAADPENRPAAVAVDVLYAGHSFAQADERLADAARDLGVVVTASMADFGEEITWDDGHAVSMDSYAVLNYEQPFEELRDVTVQGHINAMSDIDGVLRHALLYVDVDENLFTAAGNETGNPSAENTGTGGDPAGSGTQKKRVYSMACEAARLYLEKQGKEVKLPSTTTHGHFYVPFTGRPGDYYDGVSIARLINGEIPSGYWADKIVLIGPYAAALQDAYFTSIDKGEPMYGVEFQANVIQSLLEGKLKTEVPDLPQLVLLFLLLSAAVLLFVQNRVLPGAGICAGMSLAAFLLTVILYRVGFVTHPLWFPAGAAVLYILSLASHYAQAARERQALALEKERIGAELALATRIQSNALPKEFPPFPDRHEFDIYASMTPAKEVGGDLYDFFLIDDDHLALVIGDVSGKGVPAALFMMVAMTLLRHIAMREKSPAKALTLVNEEICSRNPEEMFVTVWLGVLEISTGKLTAANAGHEYPAMKKPDGSFELVKDKHGFVIGGMEGMRYREYTLQLEPGTRIFVYTDGVAEATDSKDTLFGTERMLTALRSKENGTPEEILHAITEAVQAFVGSAPQFDDLTMLCLEYNGTQPPV